MMAVNLDPYMVSVNCKSVCWPRSLVTMENEATLLVPRWTRPPLIRPAGGDRPGMSRIGQEPVTPDVKPVNPFTGQVRLYNDF